VLHVSLLGEQAIVDDRVGRVRGRSSRVVVLIAFLVLHAGSAQTRQRIAGLLWPESTDAQALTNLRRELHHLRQLLGEDPSLVVTPRELCWRDTEAVRVDVREFAVARTAALAAVAGDDDGGVIRHATAALAAYRGELLPGGYDDWLLDARAQLERQCAELCDLACDALARTDDLARAVEIARRRVRLQPFEDVGYRTLMELQAEMGDRAGAVSTYHHCEAVLERELDVAPDPATRAVFEQLMARGRTATAPRPAASRPAPAAAQLVGRSGEISRLRELWLAAAGGRRGLVLVRGSAGVGKTRLVSDLAELARLQGAVVGTAQCFGTSGRLALAPVAQWLRHDAIQSATATLDPAWSAEVSRLVPASGTGAGIQPTIDAWQRHRFLEGLARALMAVQRPLLLVLDNVHWCDPETLAFIAFYLGLADGARLLVAATMRQDDLDEYPELAGWISRMRATGLLSEVSLSPLEPADTGRLAAEISGLPLPAEDAGLLHAATGGFPLYVIEAARAAGPERDSFPAGDLSAVLRKRLDQGTAAASDVAAVAAAAATNFTLDLLTEASDLDADTVVAAVDELWRRRIIREFQDGYDFSHDLLREAAYAGISPAKRWLLHRRIAQGLELLHADNPDAVASQLAEQYARGGRPERALGYYQQAARVAAGMFAHAEQILLHEKALALVATLPAGRDRDSRELTVLEAMAAPLTAQYGFASPSLQRVLQRSISLAESLGRRDSRVAGLAALAANQFVQGRTSDSHETATLALRLAEAGSELASQAHFTVGCAAFSLGRPADTVRHMDMAVQLASGRVLLSVGTRPDVHGTALSAHAHWLLGREDAALAACGEAIALAEASDHPFSRALAFGYLSMTHQMRGDIPELRRAVAELSSMCTRYDFAYYREWALILDGWSKGDGSGISLVRRGIRSLRSASAFARMPYWLSLLADLSARAGRPDAARATLDAALAAARVHRDVWWLPEVMRMRAAYEDETAGAARLRSAARLAAEHGSVVLQRRCEQDLNQLGVRTTAAAVPRRA
jgi:DNA-binding SARP family transcriptional activator